METDKYISLGDSYIDIEVAQFLDDILNGNVYKIITQKSCKVNEKESEKNI